MANRYTVDLDTEDEDVFEMIHEQSANNDKVETWREILAEAAERRDLDEVVYRDENAETSDRIDYDPREYDARYTLSRDELHAVIREYDQPAINPDHVPAYGLPKSTAMKGEIVAAAYRYKYEPGDLVNKDRMQDVVRATIGAGSQDRLLRGRTLAAMRAMYDPERPDVGEFNSGVFIADNVDPIGAELCWIFPHYVRDYDGLDEVIDQTQRLLNLDVDDEVYENRIRGMENIIDVAKSEGREEVVERCEEVISDIESELKN